MKQGHLPSHGGRNERVMSDNRSTLPGQSDSAVTGPSDNPTTGQPSLRCQWCSVPLAAGVTTCPTCGSPGIPDPQMIVAGLTEPDVPQPDPAVAANAVAGGEVALDEWWRNEPAGAESIQTVDFAAIERRRTQSLIFIGSAVVICGLLGWLIGPVLLESPFERLTGATVEDSDDLRTMGTIGGLIVGMFFGASGGWVIWADR